jgi:hypothetical protein
MVSESGHDDITKNTLINTKRLFFDQSGKPIPEVIFNYNNFRLQFKP